MTINRNYEIPIRPVTPDTLKRCIKGLNRHIGNEQSSDKKARLIIIKEEFKQLLKELS